MAITDKEKGVWGLDEVYNKINQGGIWEYTSPEDGIFVWGTNQYGQLGLSQPTSSNASSPIQLPGNHPKLWTTSDADYAAISSSGSDATGYDLWVWGIAWRGVLGLNGSSNANISSPMQIPGTNWKHVTGSIWSMTGTKTDGTLWSWGENGSGQHGVNDRTERSSPIQVGTDTTWTGAINNSATAANHAFKTDGTLWSWGYNGYGELGLNNRTKYSSPTQVGSGAEYSAVTGRASTDIAFMKSNGTLWMAGRNVYGALGLNDTAGRSSPTQLPGTNWSSATTSYSSAMATKTDGTLWAWGNGLSGMLGINDEVKRSSPTQIGTNTNWSNTFSLGRTSGAIKTDGTLWLWGANNAGELGQNGTTQRSSPIQVGTDTDWDRLLTASWIKQTYAGKQ